MSSLKFLSRQQFKEYLSHGQLDDRYDYFQDGTVQLHWSNCELIRDYFREREHETGELLVGCEQLLKQIKNEVVWLRNRRGSIKLSLYDLYQAYCDPLIAGPLFKQSGDDQFCFSLGTEAGPYLALSGLSWMRPDIYRYFIYQKILKGLARQRQFRLSLAMPVNFSRVKTPLVVHQMRLIQASFRGLLFELPIGHRLNSERGVVDERLCLYFPKGFHYQELSNSHFKNLSQSLKQYSHTMKQVADVEASVHYNIADQMQKNYLYLDYDSFSGENVAQFRSFFSSLLEQAQSETEALFLAVA